MLWHEQRNAPHREALGAVVAHRGAGERHARDAEHEHGARPAWQRVALPARVLLQRAQRGALRLLEDLLQLLHFAVRGLVLQGDEQER